MVQAFQKEMIAVNKPTKPKQRFTNRPQMIPPKFVDPRVVYMNSDEEDDDDANENHPVATGHK